MTQLLRYFDRHARRFDRFYDVPGPAAQLRAGPGRNLAFAVSVVAAHPRATVLDVGCGPGRVGEAVLAAGASDYVGIDLSPQMLGLARRRLQRFEHFELIEGDFRAVDLRRTFAVVLALGVFEYLDDAASLAAWSRAHCSGVLVASFTRFDVFKAPVRHLHYALHGCRVFNRSESEAEALLRAAGFSSVEFPHRDARGFLVRAGIAAPR